MGKLLLSTLVVVGVGVVWASWAPMAKAEDSVFSDAPASSAPILTPVSTAPAVSSQKSLGSKRVSNTSKKHHKKGRGHKKTSTKQAKHSTHKKHHKKA